MTASSYSDRDKLMTVNLYTSLCILLIESSVYHTLHVVNIHYSNFNNYCLL